MLAMLRYLKQMSWGSLKKKHSFQTKPFNKKFKVAKIALLWQRRAKFYFQGMGGGYSGRLASLCQTYFKNEEKFKGFLYKTFFYAWGRVLGGKKCYKNYKITYNFFVTKASDLKILFLKSLWKMDAETYHTKQNKIFFTFFYYFFGIFFNPP